MAALYITEYAKLGIDSGHSVIAAPWAPSIVEQAALAIGVASVPSQPFGAGTRFVQINTDAACSLAFTGPGATLVPAVATQHRMSANETRYYAVEPGAIVSVIANT